MNRLRPYSPSIIWPNMYSPKQFSARCNHPKCKNIAVNSRQYSPPDIRLPFIAPSSMSAEALVEPLTICASSAVAKSNTFRPPPPVSNESDIACASSAIAKFTAIRTQVAYNWPLRTGNWMPGRDSGCSSRSNKGPASQFPQRFLRTSLELDDAALEALRNRLRPVPHVHLAEYVGDVRLHGALAYHQLLGNLAIRRAMSD